MPSVEKMTRAAEWYCRDANVGYSQLVRWVFPNYDPETGEGDTKTPGSCDCSSLVYQCAHLAGFNVPTSGTRYTGTIRAHFGAAGFNVMSADDVAPSELKRGDILLKSGHVAIWTGEKVAEAYGDENGNDRGGQLGDQRNDTAYGETRLSPYRGGWEWVLRYAEPAADPWPYEPPAALELADGIVEQGSNGVPFTAEQPEYAYRWRKYASGLLEVEVRDYFNPGQEQKYGSGYMIRGAKRLEFPQAFAETVPAFVELPQVTLEAIAAYNILKPQVCKLEKDGCDFYAWAAAYGIPRFIIHARVLGRWK